ncbi:MAG: protein BatD [Saprospiraceae bacterium]|nr:protein BatD [Saprospiraceae bacterium]
MIRFLLATLILFLTNILFGQVDWTVSANAKSVPAGVPFTITYSLKNSRGSNFKGPVFRNLKKLSGPRMMQHSSFVNGKSTFSIEYTYEVVAQKTGVFPLPKARITVNRKEYQTANLAKIEVVKGQVTSAAGSEKDPVILEVNISDTVAVVGQPIDFEILMHTLRSEVDFQVKRAPDFDPFYREENQNRINRVFRQVINGQTYYSKVLGHFTLYPQQEGEVKMASYNMLVQMATANQPRRRGFFDFGPRNYESFNVSSKPILLKVKPLPDGAPATFSGAVGSLDISCRADRTILTTDEGVILELKIFGSGDTKQIQAPEILSNDSLEVYPAKLKTERQEERSWGVEKVKIYEYDILPKYPGEYLIDPTFVYFDTDSLRYVTKSCQPIRMRVSQGSARSVQKATQPVIDDGLAPLVEVGKTSSLPGPGLSPGLAWSLFGSIGLGMLGMVGYRIYLDNLPEEDLIQMRKDAAQNVALTQLATAKGFLDSGGVRDFYESLSTSMYRYLVDKLQLDHADLNLSDIREILTNRSVPEEFILKFEELIQNAQRAIYGGSNAQEGMSDQYEAARNWIMLMEKWFQQKG